MIENKIKIRNLRTTGIMPCVMRTYVIFFQTSLLLSSSFKQEINNIDCYGIILVYLALMT